MPVKQNLKEHYEDGKLDLSMLSLTEVPVKDIAAIPKATNLDLSNNRLTTFGKNFPSSLTYLVHLDLARNQLTELPENIGLLVNLKHLDLYSNQLTSLPLSFGNLKALKWLDLKQNPLMPKLAQIAGPCLDSAQCGSAARNVVELLAMMNKQVETEKQRRQEQRQKQLEENVRKAQEQKKELQLQKKKNKKAKREENEQAKLLESMGNGDGALTDEALNENDEMLDNEDVMGNESSESSDCVKSNLKIPSVTSKALAVFGTLIKTIVIFTLLIILSLFILNLIDEDYYNSTMKHINKVKNQVSNYIPKSVSTKYNKMYYSSRKMFWRTTNRFGKKSLALIQQVQDWYYSVSNDETIQAYFEQIKSGWQVLWIRISEIYRTFWVHS